MKGKVNESQDEDDLTITEKLDGDYSTLKQMKKVLTSSFDHKSTNNRRMGWVSSLRTPKDNDESIIDPNKRTVFNRSSSKLKIAHMRESAEIKSKKSLRRDFVSECTQKSRKGPNHRYVF